MEERYIILFFFYISSSYVSVKPVTLQGCNIESAETLFSIFSEVKKDINFIFSYIIIIFIRIPSHIEAPYIEEEEAVSQPSLRELQLRPPIPRGTPYVEVRLT